MDERLPRFAPPFLDDAQRKVYAQITGGPRAAGPQHFPLTHDDGSLRGPFNALLVAPAIGSAVQNLGAAIRYQGTLTDRAREIAILLVAAHWNSAFERESHEAVGRAAGLDERELEALRAGDTNAFTGTERIVADTTVQLLAGDLDDPSWASAAQMLGVDVIFELSTLVGYYALLALQLRTFRVSA